MEGEDEESTREEEGCDRRDAGVRCWRWSAGVQREGEACVYCLREERAGWCDACALRE